MTKQPLSLSTLLGTGAFCAALVAAPLATGLLSSSAYALDSGMTKNCTSEVLTKLGTNMDELNALVVSDANLADAINSAKAMPNYTKYAAVFDEYLNLIWGEWLDAGAETADTATQKTIATKFMNAIRDAGFTLVNEPSIIDEFDAATSQYGLLNEVYSAWKEAHPEWSTYYDIYSAINYEKLSGNGGPTYTKADAFVGILCSATKADASFKINYTTSTNPFDQFMGGIGNPATGDSNTGNTGNNNTPNTTTQPTTIESSDKNVKVSGINININYTLNVSLVSADLLKLTGNDFKNSTNQAFYDIYLYDSQDNRIENTGNVSVYIKLPSNMSVNSDFVVYYVPTAANGEYLTDQAQAIKGVKVSSDGWLTFQTDHFSVYGIVEYPKNKAPNTGVVAQSDGSATTTGAKVVAGVIATLTAAGAGIVARRQVLRCKKSKNQQ